MLRARLLVVPLAGLGLFGLAGAPSGPDAAITSAAVAPYRDELLLNAPGLCSTLTPQVAAMVVPDAPPGTSCEQAVQQIFAATAPPRGTRIQTGRTVFAESGCLACHKIDQIGNPGPGQNLTHVGAQLSPHEIEKALVSPRAPMPSFKRLSANKRHDLVRFLSLLR